MTRIPQRTIKKEVSFENKALFSGQKVKLTLRSAPADTGVIFIRTDLPGKPQVAAVAGNITSHYRRTGVQKNGAAVETIEHLLAAVNGLGIDNLFIDINASEMPGTDGSSQPFVELLNEAGLTEQDVVQDVLALPKAVSFSQGESSLVALPPEKGVEGLTIDYTLKYDAPLIGTQYLTVHITPESFVKELASSRTFCLKSEVDHFLKKGLGKGASYDNTLVVDEDKVIKNKLRFKDEFVRHKILDLVGDLALVGRRFSARIIAVKTGHEHNVKFVEELSKVLTEAQPGSATKTWLDVREIQNILPHRYPFLLIDKIIEMEGYNRIVGIKNVTVNEPFFMGHFPGQPIMPGVLQLEAMVQLGAVLLLRRSGATKKLGVLLSLDKVKFRKSVVPGDQLRIEAETIKSKTRTAEIQARALVDGELASEASIKFILVDKE